MDIPLFVKSLSGTEVEILKKYLNEAFQPLTTKDFLRKNEMSIRLRNVLTENLESFEYVSDINKHLFMRLPKAGIRSWEEFEWMLKNIL